jgi:guanylate kinase
MMPDANLVFIAPPSWDELINRLKGRGTESEAEMTVRLETAKAELAQQDLFDHIVINDEVATCAQNIVQLMQ